jgi:RNA polymerase sigma-70 factor (ECF subfamily)
VSHSSQTPEIAARPALRLVPPGTSEPDDPTLVQALIAGEEWAARVTWNRYAPLVYGVLDRALGSSSESEDLTQEVFWRLFASIKRLRDPSALRSFIYSSAIRMLRWHLRKKRVRRFLSLSDTGEVPDGRTEAADSEGRELLARFYRMLGELKPDDRTAFVLRQVEGLSLQEIAEVTGSSLATVKRRIRRAFDVIDRLGNKYPEFAEYRRQSPLAPGGTDGD